MVIFVGWCGISYINIGRFSLPSLKTGHIDLQKFILYSSDFIGSKKLEEVNECEEEKDS